MALGACGEFRMQRAYEFPNALADLPGSTVRMCVRELSPGSMPRRTDNHPKAPWLMIVVLRLTIRLLLVLLLLLIMIRITCNFHASPPCLVHLAIAPSPQQDTCAKPPGMRSPGPNEHVRVCTRHREYAQ